MGLKYLDRLPLYILYQAERYPFLFNLINSCQLLAKHDLTTHLSKRMSNKNTNLKYYHNYKIKLIRYNCKFCDVICFKDRRLMWAVFT